MEQEVLISIQPKWLERIANKEKTAELRKTAPKETPFRVYMYATTTGPWNLCFDRSEGAEKKVVLAARCRNAKKIAEANGLEIVSGKVIGEFICKEVKTVCPDQAVVMEDLEEDLAETCLTREELKEYLGWKRGMKLSDCRDGYSWQISDLVIYDEPMELGEFLGRTLVWRGMNHVHDREPLKRPPQSWQYVKKKGPVLYRIPTGFNEDSDVYVAEETYAPGNGTVYVIKPRAVISIEDEILTVYSGKRYFLADPKDTYLTLMTDGEDHEYAFVSQKEAELFAGSCGRWCCCPTI